MKPSCPLLRQPPASMHPYRSDVSRCAVSWALLGCGVSAASVLWLPYQAITFLVRSGGSSQLPDSPLGDASRLLALVMLHHAPPVEAGVPNPFRQALQQLQV